MNNQNLRLTSILKSSFHSMIWLSLKTKIPVSTLQDYDSGTIQPSKEMIQKIAMAFHMNDEELTNMT